MTFRKATLNDQQYILGIINDAIKRLSDMHIDQWQNGYPNIDTIIQDIQNQSLYVLEVQDQIVSIAALLFEPEPTYQSIKGSWGNKGENAITIHRLASVSHALNKGYASLLLTHIKNAFQNHTLRIDTHTHNIPMTRLILKNDFVYRGVITLLDGSYRDAYDFIPQSNHQ